MVRSFFIECPIRKRELFWDEVRQLRFLITILRSKECARKIQEINLLLKYQEQV